MPNPLLCEEYYNQFLAVTNVEPDEQVGRLKSLIENLPQEHQKLLKYLLSLLVKICTVNDSPTEAMDLANAIGPDILRATDATMKSSLADSQRVVSVVLLLIEKANEIFEDMDSVVLNCIVTEDGTKLSPNRKQIISATKEKIVSTLYSDCEGLNAVSVTTIVPKFLLTYRAFMTSQELLEILSTTFNSIQGDSEVEDRYKKLIRICNFFRKWTEEQYYEFQLDPSLLNRYRNFVGKILDAKLLDFMMKSLDKLNHQKEKTLVFPNPPPKPLVPKSKGVLKFMDIRPLELARQLTLIDFNIFKSIRPQELCEGAWMGKEKEQKAPHVIQFAQRFNTMVHWFMTLILQAKNQHKRESIVQRMIEVASQFQELNNFNGMMQIIAALQSAPVSRLACYSRKVASNPAFEELHEIMSHKKNYKYYREVLRSRNPPILPYVGCFQTDLVFIEDGHKILLENGDILFKKCYLVAKVIQEVQQYQQTPYNLQVVDSIRDLVIDLHPCTEEECWQLSTQIKPSKHK